MTSWRRVADLRALPDGAPYPVTLDDTRLALYRIGDAVHAVGDVCTHEYVRLSGGAFAGCVIECPLHHARFDVVTGRCLARPAATDLATYPVRVDDDTVWVRI